MSDRIDLKAILILVSLMILWNIIVYNLPLPFEWRMTLCFVGGIVIGFVTGQMGIQVYRFRKD